MNTHERYQHATRIQINGRAIGCIIDRIRRECPGLAQGELTDSAVQAYQQALSTIGAGVDALEKLAAELRGETKGGSK